jgi:hypothetical protein
LFVKRLWHGRPFTRAINERQDEIYQGEGFGPERLGNREATHYDCPKNATMNQTEGLKNLLSFFSYCLKKLSEILYGPPHLRAYKNEMSDPKPKGLILEKSERPIK